MKDAVLSVFTVPFLNCLWNLYRQLRALITFDFAFLMRCMPYGGLTGLENFLVCKNTTQSS